MEDLKTKRKGFRVSFTMYANALEVELSSETLDSKSTLILKHQLKDKFDGLSACQEKVLNEILKLRDSEEAYLEDLKIVKGYKDHYFALGAEIDRKNGDAALLKDLNETRKLKLLKIELKKFSGDAKEFEFLDKVMKNAISGRATANLTVLYDEVMGKLQVQESLGRTQQKCGDFVIPLVESCLPEDVLIAWERNRMSRSLDNIMKYLKKEVINEEMIEPTRTGSGINRGKKADVNKVVISEMLSTAALENTLNSDRDSSSHKNETEVSTKVMTNSTLQTVLLMTLRVVSEIGADIAGLIMTGSSVQLSSGVIVLETRLGHTLLGMENLGGSLVPTAEVIEAMFLLEKMEPRVSNIDRIDAEYNHQRVKYRVRLLVELRRHFRKEYMGQLIQNWSLHKEHLSIRVGDLVFLDDDYRKHLNWPLARVLELLQGKDGKVRTVKLRTENGVFLHSIQRIYPLEHPSNDSIFLVQRLVGTRDTNVEKAADVSMDPHSISDIPQHQAEISCVFGVSVDSYSVSDSLIGLQYPCAPPHDTTVTRSGRLVKKPQRF
ncbi:hypothetical protein HNY73_006924 [Argiope bruennichi]|uniref:DUF5641 domain-containing protein n=1 Tax=Argiope bruennichi TaxID=94029 RepID=A0A8T0FCT8_ARGBR|nr:hypothetical protein HNY73_006924 [Argiope bruennichi]